MNGVQVWSDEHPVIIKGCHTTMSDDLVHVDNERMMWTLLLILRITGQNPRKIASKIVSMCEVGGNDGVIEYIRLKIVPRQ